MPDYSQLGPVLNSIMGSQDREFAHAEGMQSQSLSAQQAMHKGSLANAMKIAKLQEGTQRYGIDVGKEVSFRGQDVQRYGIDQNTLQARWANALNYLSMGSQLKGPGDWLSYLNFTRGAANQGAPAFLQSLMGEGGVQDFGAMGGVATPSTLAGIAADMGGGGTAPNGPGGAGLTPQQQQTIGAVDTIAANMHRLAPGSLEGLSEDESNFLLGTAASRGHSIPTLLHQYAMSRPSQGSGVGA